MTTPLTFLFTDLENSTRLWGQFPNVMRPALAQQSRNRIIEISTEAQENIELE